MVGEEEIDLEWRINLSIIVPDAYLGLRPNIVGDMTVSGSMCLESGSWLRLRTTVLARLSKVPFAPCCIN